MGRRSDARQRLIRAASQLVYDRGYNAVGVQEICDRAGVNKGSFYHFFPAKRDLLLAVIDARADWLRGILDRVEAAETQPLERIRQVFLEVGGFNREVRDRDGRTLGCPFGNLAGELNAQDEVVRAKIEEIFDEATHFFAAQVREAIASGDLDQGVHPRSAARAILAYLEGLQLLATTHDAPDLVGELADGALHLVGLQPGGSPRPAEGPRSSRDDLERRTGR